MCIVNDNETEKVELIKNNVLAVLFLCEPDNTIS